MTTFNPKKCTGCKNISETRFPFGLNEITGKYYIDSEECAIDIDNKHVGIFEIEYCPVCNAEIPCGICGGTGEISTSEQVYANEPHMADIGSAPCPAGCK